MAVLTKKQILAADDHTKQIVRVDEWGGEVYVKTMTGKERDEFETAIFDTSGTSVTVNRSNIRALLCAMTIVDESGTRLFDGADDITALGTKSASALDKVYSVASALNRLSSADVEELAKNSNSGQRAATSSDSVDILE